MATLSWPDFIKQLQSTLQSVLQAFLVSQHGDWTRAGEWLASQARGQFLDPLADFRFWLKVIYSHWESTYSGNFTLGPQTLLWLSQTKTLLDGEAHAKSQSWLEVDALVQGVANFLRSLTKARDPRHTVQGAAEAADCISTLYSSVIKKGDFVNLEMTNEVLVDILPILQTKARDTVTTSRLLTEEEVQSVYETSEVILDFRPTKHWASQASTSFQFALSSQLGQFLEHCRGVFEFAFVEENSGPRPATFALYGFPPTITIDEVKKLLKIFKVEPQGEPHLTPDLGAVFLLARPGTNCPRKYRDANLVVYELQGPYLARLSNLPQFGSTPAIIIARIDKLFGKDVLASLHYAEGNKWAVAHCADAPGLGRLSARPSFALFDSLKPQDLPKPQALVQNNPIEPPKPVPSAGLAQSLPPVAGPKASVAKAPPAAASYSYEVKVENAKIRWLQLHGRGPLDKTAGAGTKVALDSGQGLVRLTGPKADVEKIVALVTQLTAPLETMKLPARAASAWKLLDASPELTSQANATKSCLYIPIVHPQSQTKNKPPYDLAKSLPVSSNRGGNVRGRGRAKGRGRGRGGAGNASPPLDLSAELPRPKRLQTDLSNEESVEAEVCGESTEALELFYTLLLSMHLHTHTLDISDIKNHDSIMKQIVQWNRQRLALVSTVRGAVLADDEETDADETEKVTLVIRAVTEANLAKVMLEIDAFLGELWAELSVSLEPIKFQYLQYRRNYLLKGLRALGVSVELLQESSRLEIRGKFSLVHSSKDTIMAEFGTKWASESLTVASTHWTFFTAHFKRLTTGIDVAFLFPDMSMHKDPTVVALLGGVAEQVATIALVTREIEIATKRLELKPAEFAKLQRHFTGQNKKVRQDFESSHVVSLAFHPSSNSISVIGDKKDVDEALSSLKSASISDSPGVRKENSRGGGTDFLKILSAYHLALLELKFGSIQELEKSFAPATAQIIPGEASDEGQGGRNFQTLLALSGSDSHIAAAVAKLETELHSLAMIAKSRAVAADVAFKTLLDNHLLDYCKNWKVFVTNAEQNRVVWSQRIGGTAVEVCLGDLLHEQTVFALVSPANQQLSHLDSVAKAISEAAGVEYREECEDFVQTQGFLPRGKALACTPGNLGYLKRVINASCPRWEGGAKAEATALASVVKSVLELVVSEGVSSVAMPLLSSGAYFGFPLAKCAEVLASQLRASLSASLPISRVRLVVSDRPQAQALAAALHTASLASPPVPAGDSKSMLRQWHFLDCSGVFQAYDEASNSEIDAAFSLRHETTPLLIAGNYYLIHFLPDGTIQEDMSTGAKTRVKFTSRSAPRASDAPPPALAADSDALTFVALSDATLDAAVAKFREWSASLQSTTTVVVPTRPSAATIERLRLLGSSYRVTVTYKPERSCFLLSGAKDAISIVASRLAQDLAAGAGSDPSAGLTPAESDALKAILSVLPETDVDVAIRALRQAKGDAEAAVNLILTAQVIPAPLRTAAAAAAAVPEQVEIFSAANEEMSAEDSLEALQMTIASLRSTSDGSDRAQQLLELLEKRMSELLKAKRLFSDQAQAQQAIIGLLSDDVEATRGELVEANRKKKELEESGKLWMPAEQLAIELGILRIFRIYPRREFDNNAASMHYRTAESQFHRLNIGGGSAVTMVEYLVNPVLIQKFEAKRQEMAKRLKWEETKPILCFHGTSAQNIDGIVRTNFLVSRVGSSTDSGYYGAGIYFSEFPATSMGYARDTSKFLLCLVLAGKAYRCPGRMDGAPKQNGYDSHLSPDGQEVVIFHSDQILPVYIVHYGAQQQHHAQFAGVQGVQLAHHPKAQVDDYYDLA